MGRETGATSIARAAVQQLDPDATPIPRRRGRRRPETLRNAARPDPGAGGRRHRHLAAEEPRAASGRAVRVEGALDVEDASRLSLAAPSRLTRVQTPIASSAVSASTSPKTCGWRRISFSRRPSAIVARSPAPRSSISRARNQTWNRRSPSSSRSAASSPAGRPATSPPPRPCGGRSSARPARGPRGTRGAAGGRSRRGGQRLATGRPRRHGPGQPSGRGGGAAAVRLHAVPAGRRGDRNGATSARRGRGSAVPGGWGRCGAPPLPTPPSGRTRAAPGASGLRELTGGGQPVCACCSEVHGGVATPVKVVAAVDDEAVGADRHVGPLAAVVLDEGGEDLLLLLLLELLLELGLDRRERLGAGRGDLVDLEDVEAERSLDGPTTCPAGAEDRLVERGLERPRR